MADLPQTSFAALKAELTNDPKALGLVGKTDQQAADLLNTVGLSVETVSVTGVLDAYLVINAVNAAEYGSLTAAEKTRFETITGAGKVDPNNTNVTAAFAAMFGAGTATRTALLALANRSCSRAEKLFGAGTVLNAWDVGRARAS
jgi:hypothetical protein